MSRLLHISLLFSAFLMPVTQAEPLILAMPHFPPFTYLDEWGNPAGIGYEEVSHVLKKAKIDFTVEPVPNYGRALAETRLGNVDGFFIASQNAERDAVADFSGGMMDNPWSWYHWPDEQGDLCQQSIATILNTNTHRWLQARGCPLLYPEKTPQQLVQLLLKRKIHSVFIAREVMHKALTDAGIPLNHFAEQVEVIRPVGLYLSHKVIAADPLLMPTIRQVISDTPAK